MNWVFGASWLWRAVRGQSVTFAALFAFALFGVSIGHLVRRVFAAFGAPWLLLVLLPFLLIGYLARHEEQWMPDARRRKLWARGLIVGSVALAVLIARFTPNAPETASPSSSPPHTHRSPHAGPAFR